MTPLPGDQGAYAAAQATLDAGPRQAMELSYQATVVSLNMDQAANAAAQTTMDYNQRQLMELSIRGTEVSQNMARAAATQQFIAEQTQLAWNAMTTAQSQAATEYAAQTAQAQANATQTAYSLTATPWAAIQAGIDTTTGLVGRVCRHPFESHSIYPGRSPAHRGRGAGLPAAYAGAGAAPAHHLA